MPRRRLYAELEPAPEEEAAQSSWVEPDKAAERGLARSPLVDSPQGRVIALQRGAGNAATGRLLRKVADAGQQGAARETNEGQQDAEPVPDDELVRRERTILENVAVPTVLDRLFLPELKGVRESLPEVALFARSALAQRMQDGANGAGPVQLRSTATDIQMAVMKVARQRNIIVPGHRPFGDPAGLEVEAKALGDLIGKDFKDLGKVETSAEGITFEMAGELKASRQLRGGALGGGPAPKDSGRIELKVDAMPVELKGEILAKSGRPTKWSAKLEIKIADGKEALPDAGSIAKLVSDAGHGITEAAHALDTAMMTQRDVDKQAVEQALKPSKDSLEELVGYMELHTAEMEARPHPPPVPGSKDSDGGSVSAQITLAITF